MHPQRQVCRACKRHHLRGQKRPKSKDGTINVTLNNLSLDAEKEVLITFDALKASDVEASVVTGAMNAHNTFDKPEVVTTEKLESVKIAEDGIRVVLPARSVTLLRVK
ncbi:MAG: hypothetical protein J6U10_04030 [Lachnospiraceae bacterium]|nr:hypothetical protein [Lachnospiraceae bacterium]